MCVSRKVGIVLVALGGIGCQTIETEQNRYSLPTEKSKNTIFDAELKVLEDEAREYPKRHDLHYRIAGIHFRKENYRECVRALHSAIELSPRMSKYHYHLGRVYLLMGELRDAEQHFRTSAESIRHDRYTGPRMALAYTLWRQGKLQDSIREFEECLRIDPNAVEFYYYLGSLHDAADDEEGVVKYYREYLIRGGRRYREKAVFVLEKGGVDVPEVDRSLGPARAERGFEAGPPEFDSALDETGR